MPPPKDPTKREEYRKALSEKMKQRSANPEWRRKLSEAAKRQFANPEARQFISKTNKGRFPSEETRKKLSASRSGNKNPRFGKLVDIETRKKMADGRKKANLDRFWYGAVTYSERPQYCEKWNENLRERVRAYWGYKCVECGIPQNGRKLHVHHVHYNKETCCDGSPRDLVPLCSSCHVATNHNREYWEDHFTDLIYTDNPEGKCFFTHSEMEAWLSCLHS